MLPPVPRSLPRNSRTSPSSSVAWKDSSVGGSNKLHAMTKLQLACILSRQKHAWLLPPSCNDGELAVVEPLL